MLRIEQSRIKTAKQSCRRPTRLPVQACLSHRIPCLPWLETHSGCCGIPGHLPAFQAPHQRSLRQAWYTSNFSGHCRMTLLWLGFFGLISAQKKRVTLSLKHGAPMGSLDPQPSGAGHTRWGRCHAVLIIAGRRHSGSGVTCFGTTVVCRLWECSSYNGIILSSSESELVFENGEISSILVS